jgi:peptide deformylase
MITKNLNTLKTKSNNFTGNEEDLKALISSLEFELFNSPAPGVGLSAIQVGIPERVAIIRCGKGKTNLDLYNATIIEKFQPFVFKDEGCLSFPGKFIDTNRYNMLKIKNGDGKEYKFSGFVAVAIQHELDHWDGVVYMDRQSKE